MSGGHRARRVQGGFHHIKDEQTLYFDSRNAAAKELGVPPESIFACCDGKQKEVQDTHGKYWSCVDPYAVLVEDVMEQIKTKLSCFFEKGRPYLDLHPGQIMYTKGKGDTVNVWIVDLGSMIEENDVDDEDEPSKKKYATSYPRFGVENYNSDDCCYVVDKKDSAKWIDWLCFIALAGIVLPNTRGYLDVCHRCNEFGPTLHNVSILVDAVKKQPVTEYERIKTFVTPIEELVKNAKTNKKRSLIEMAVGAVGAVGGFFHHLLIPEGGQDKRTRLNLEGGH